METTKHEVREIFLDVGATVSFRKVSFSDLARSESLTLTVKVDGKPIPSGAISEATREKYKWVYNALNTLMTTIPTINGMHLIQA